MRIFKKVLLLCLLVMALGSLGSGSEAKAQPGRSVPVSVFYQELQPYGRWIQYGNYGRAWIPRVEKDFRPYVTRGYWGYTEYGNTWVSDYEWGWAPFHYGRWAYDDLYGWVWVPDSEWAPAWVSWRHDDDNYGWAPLGPGVNIDININIPIERWIFVPKRYVTSRRVYDYCLPAPRVQYVYGRSRMLDRNYDRSNSRYVYGPRREDLERETRRPVEVHSYSRDGRPTRTQSGGIDNYRDSRTEVYGRNDNNQNRNRSSDDSNPGTNNSGNWRNGRPERGIENAGDKSQAGSNGSGRVSSEGSGRNYGGSADNSSDRGSSSAGNYSRPARGSYDNSSQDGNRQGPSSSDRGNSSPVRSRSSQPSGSSDSGRRERSSSDRSDRASGTSAPATGNTRPTRSIRS